MTDVVSLSAFRKTSGQQESNSAAEILTQEDMAFLSFVYERTSLSMRSQIIRQTLMDAGYSGHDHIRFGDFVREETGMDKRECARILHALSTYYADVASRTPSDMDSKHVAGVIAQQTGEMSRALYPKRDAEIKAFPSRKPA
jgi:hypothetical protein